MSEISDTVQFIEERPDHHFRTEIPNFIFDVLNPNQLAVYCHIKRICGDSGRCWMSMSNLAKTIGLGETTVRQCLKELSQVDFLVEGSFIEVVRRKKSDGSQDSNIIRIVDVWRINGNHYRGQAKQGGSSPREGGVVRQTKRGGSPNDDKQEHSQEKPSKETNKQPVVVCSSLDEEKKKILEPYRLSGKLLDQFVNLSVEHLKDAVAAFEQYRAAQEATGTKVDNPVGALRNAIVGGWKPNVTKADKEREKVCKMQNIENRIKKHHQIAKELFEKHCHAFHDEFEFSVSDNVVSLRYQRGSYFPLALNDESFETVLSYYIESKGGK